MSTIGDVEAITGLISGDDLFDMGNIGPCELIDGRIVPMSPTGGEHGGLETNLSIELGMFVRQHKLGYVVGGEVGIYIQRNPDRIRGADLAWDARPHPDAPTSSPIASGAQRRPASGHRFPWHDDPELRGWERSARPIPGSVASVRAFRFAVPPLPCPSGPDPNCRAIDPFLPQMSTARASRGRGRLMSFRALKRLFGETSLERKCRVLLGAGILLLTSASFWLYAWQTEQVAFDQIFQQGRLLVQPALAERHLDPAAHEAMKEHHLAWESHWLTSANDYHQDWLKPNAQNPRQRPSGDDRLVVERFLADPSLREEIRWNREQDKVYFYASIRTSSSCLTCHPLNATEREEYGGSLREGDLMAVLRFDFNTEAIRADIHRNRAWLIANALGTAGACKLLGAIQLWGHRGSQQHAGFSQVLCILGGLRRAEGRCGVAAACLVAEVGSIEVRTQHTGRILGGSLLELSAQPQHGQDPLLAGGRRGGDDAGGTVAQVCRQHRAEGLGRTVHEIGTCTAVDVQVDVAGRYEAACYEAWHVRPSLG